MMRQALIVAAAMLVLLAAQAGAQNFIVNGGFETGDLTSWDTNVAYPSDYAVVTSPVHSGSYAVMVRGVDGDRIIQQYRTLTPGVQYKFSMWYRGGAELFLRIVGTTNYIQVPSAAPDWQYFEYSFVAGANANASWARVALLARGAVYYIDDISVKIDPVIAGTVTNSSTGLPVAGVTVRTSDGSSSAVTDSSGKYMLTGLSPGTYDIEFRDYRYYDYQQTGVVFTGDTQVTVDAAMNPRPTATITGTVTSSGGGAVSGAMVWVLEKFEAFTNASGQYTLTVPANSYTLSTRAPGFHAQSRPVNIAGGQTLVENFVLDPGYDELIVNGGFETGDLTGWTEWTRSGDVVRTVQGGYVHSGDRALRIDGIGLSTEGGLLQVIDTIPGETLRLSMRIKYTGPGWAHLGYNLDGVTTTPWTTSNMGWAATRGNNWAYWSREFTATGRKTTVFLHSWNNTGVFIDDVTVISPGSIAGSVTDSGTGLPATNVPISTFNGIYTTLTDQSGNYTLPNLMAGTYDVEFGDYRYVSTIAPDVAVQPNVVTQLNVQVTMRGVGAVGGTVTDSANGLPLADARVWISGIPGVPDTQFEAFTNSAGQYTITGIPANTYTLNVHKPGYVEQAAQVTINDGSTAEANWSLAWRVVNATNAVTNGDFEAGTLEPWTVWSATHYGTHQELDPNCKFGDQFIGNHVSVSATQGHASATGVQIAVAGGSLSAGCGGVRQACYVEPGKFYRVKAMFKGNIAPDIANDPSNAFEVALGLVDDRFDPGVYSDAYDPPQFADDVVKIQCHADWWGAGLVAEPDMWWHNIMATRSKGYHGVSSWDWTSTMDYVAPRNYLASCVKQATGDVLTVVLYARATYNIWTMVAPYSQSTAVFDDVVLEEVPNPAAELKLGDLLRLDMRPPYGGYPDLLPVMRVDLSNPANAKLVTGVFADGYYAPTTYYYVEEPDRSAGIRIDVNEYDYVFEPQTGDLLNLVGTLTVLDTGERVIKADLGSHQVVSQGNALPKPVSFALKNASAKLPFSNPLNQQVGPSNTGLLATVTGRVVDSFFDGYGYWLTIEDGSGKDLIVRGAPQQVANGTQVVVTGIVGIDNQGSPEPAMFIQIRPDTAAADFYTIP